MSECLIMRNLALFVNFGLTWLKHSTLVGRLLHPCDFTIVLEKDLYAVEG